MATIQDVARRAMVSKATVSRVLNGKPDVDAATAARIRDIVAEIGYVPRASAVGLAKGSSQCIGLLVPSLSWPWITPVLQGVAEQLEHRGYGLLLYTMGRGAESLHAFQEQVSRVAFDGLVVVVPPELLDYVVRLYVNGLPVVLIDDRGYHPELPSIATTNRDGAASAVAHLLGRGRRRIACVTGPAAYGVTEQRLAGARQALAEAGLRLPKKRVAEGDFTEAGGYAAAGALLAHAPDTDAVFAQNDLMAAGVLRRLRESGRRVPDDVAIVGFDDVAIAEMTRPPLTSVHQPLHEMGATAVDLVIKHVGGERLPPEPVVLPTNLVVRGST